MQQNTKLTSSRSIFPSFSILPAWVLDFPGFFLHFSLSTGLFSLASTLDSVLSFLLVHGCFVTRVVSGLTLKICLMFPPDQSYLTAALLSHWACFIKPRGNKTALSLAHSTPPAAGTALLTTPEDHISLSQMNRRKILWSIPSPFLDLFGCKTNFQQLSHLPSSISQLTQSISTPAP